MFEWTIIVLLALSNPCFFILLMPLEGILSSNTREELSPTPTHIRINIHVNPLEVILLKKEYALTHGGLHF